MAGIKLNCEGTIVEAPLGLVKKSKMVAEWWNRVQQEGKEDEAIMRVECSPKEMHELLRKLFGRSRVEDYLGIGEGRMYDVEDKCEIRMCESRYWYEELKHIRRGFELTFSLESMDKVMKVFFVIDSRGALNYQRCVHCDLGSFWDGERRHKCTKKNNENENGNYMMLVEAEKYFFAMKLSSTHFNCIEVTNEDVRGAINKCAKKMEISWNAYVKKKGLFVMNARLEEVDPKYEGTFFLDAGGGDVREVLGELIYQYHKDLCWLLGSRLSVVRRMVELCVEGQKIDL